MAAPRPIRLQLTINGPSIDVSKVQRAAATAGDLYGRTFQKAATRQDDGTVVINRTSTSAGRRTVGEDGTVYINRGPGPRFQRQPDGTLTRTADGGTARQIRDQLKELAGTAYGQSTAGQSYLRKLGSASKDTSTALDKVGGAIVKIAASLYTLRTVGGMIDKYLVAPFVAFGERLVDTSDKYRQFVNAVSGPIGGFNRADAVGRELFRQAATSPLTAEDLQNATRQASFLPSLNGRFGTQSPVAVAKQTTEFATLLGQLGTLDRDQGAAGAGVAVREFLSGDARSLRLRLEISPDDVAAGIGKSLPQVLGDPRLGLRALQNYTNQYIGGSFDDRSGLLSNAGAKITDNISRVIIEATGATGGGLYDTVTDRLRGLNDTITKYLDGPEWGKAKTKIGDSLGRVLDGVGDSVLQLVGKLTGSGTNLQSLTSVGDIASTILDRLADLIAQAPALAAAVGGSVRSLIESVQKLPVAIEEAAKAIRDFDPVKKSAGGVVGAFGMLPVNVLTAAMSLVPGSGVRLPTAAGPSPADTPQKPPTSQPVAPTSIAVNPLATLAEMGKAYAGQREVRALIERGLIGQNPRPLVAAMLSELDRTSGGFSLESDDFQRMSAMRASLFDRLQELTRGSDGKVASYSGLLENAEGNFNAIGEARDNPLYRQRLTAAGVTGSEQTRYFDSLEADYRGRLDALKGLPLRLQREVQKIAGATADSFAKLNPQIATTLADRIGDGSKQLAEQIGEALQLSPEIVKRLEEAVQNAPVALQERIASASRDARLAAIKQVGELGAINPAMSYADLLRTGPVDSLTTAKNELTERTTGRTGQDLSRLYETARAAYQADPSDDNLAVFGRIAQRARENQQQVMQLTVQTDGFLSVLRQVGTEGRQALTSTLGTAFADLITQSGSVEDAFRSMARSLVQSFSDASAQQIIRALLGDTFDGSDKNGGTGAGGGLLSILGSAVSSYFSAGASASATTATTAMADGGILNRPTLTLAGEAGMEAYVPMRGGKIPIGMSKSGQFFAKLPKGRTIPAELHGGSITAFADGGVWAGRGPAHFGGGQVMMPPAPAFNGGAGGGNTYIVNDVDAAVRAGFVKNRDTIISVVHGDIQKGGSIGKAIRR